VARLRDVAPFEVFEWPNRVDIEVSSSTEWRRAIIEGRVAHDGHATLGEHVSATVVQATSDGSLRLSAPPDGRPVDAARAARMAWWRALDVASRLESPAIY
jgi:hypothetical protein